MTVIQALILGLSVGTLGSTAGYYWYQNRDSRWEQMQEQQSETILSLANIQGQLQASEAEVEKNLTAPDLLDVACSKEYLESHGDILCREMFCRLQTHMAQGATQNECEEISNVANSLLALKECKAMDIKLDTCTDYINRRK